MAKPSISLVPRCVDKCDEFSLLHVRKTQYTACIYFDLDEPYFELYAKKALQNAIIRACRDFGEILDKVEDVK